MTEWTHTEDDEWELRLPGLTIQIEGEDNHWYVFAYLAGDAIPEADGNRIYDAIGLESAQGLAVDYVLDLLLRGAKSRYG